VAGSTVGSATIGSIFFFFGRIIVVVVVGRFTVVNAIYNE
jgi:hypothetical protein